MGLVVMSATMRVPGIRVDPTFVGFAPTAIPEHAPRRIIRHVPSLDARDTRALLEIVNTIAYDCEADAFSEATLQHLCELLGADWVTYLARDNGAAGYAVDVEAGSRPFAGHCAELEVVFHALRHENPMCGLSAVPDSGVLMIGDVATRRALERTAWYNEWCRAVHVEPQAKVLLSDAGGSAARQRMLVVDLADDALRGFGERERLILELIRPWFARPAALGDAARARCRALGITRREIEVLTLVREGLTNGEIAARLFVSPTTVRSHLENAFAKLSAHTRTEAVARMGAISPTSQHGA